MKTIRKIPLLLFFVLFFCDCKTTKISTTFYDLNLANETKIIFLIDISSSMGDYDGKVLEKQHLKNVVVGTAEILIDEAVDFPVSDVVELFRKPQKPALNKLDKVKNRLIPVIEGLEENATFTIIYFGTKTRKWRNSMVPANRRNKKNAISFIKDIKPRGETNISMALEDAFKLAGKGAVNPNVPINVKTIVLLTDGSPTIGKIRKPDDIINKTAEWNSLRRININTIGLGSHSNTEFLRKLAEENGGTFVEHLDNQSGN